MPFTRRQFVVGLSALSALGASIPFLPTALADATGEAVSGRRVFNLLINPEPPSLSSFNTTAEAAGFTVHTRELVTVASGP